MSDHEKRPLVVMKATADDIVDELSPFCERIEIAGSVRRKRPAAGDIEIVCIPKMEARPEEEALFPGTIECDLLEEYLVGALPRIEAGWTTRPPGAFGPRYKRLMRAGVPVDLFSVISPALWGVVFLIRTGPAGFSRRMVTQRTKGGNLPDDMSVEGGAILDRRPRKSGPYAIVVNPRPIEVPVLEEEDFFRICGMDYIPPEQRAG